MSENEKNINKRYIKMVPVPIRRLPDGCDRLKSLCEQNGIEQSENAAILAKACDRVGKGKILFVYLCKGQLKVTIKEALGAYEVAKTFPEPEADVSALAEEIARAYRENLREQMGFQSKTDGNGFTVNANIFTRYFLDRVGLVLLGEETWVLYNQNGYYEIVTEAVIGKLVRNMLNSAVKDFWRNSTGNEILAALKLEAGQVNELNTCRELLNLENGMLNIDTGELLPHSPEYLSTVRIPFAYDPEAECLRFLQFIEEVTEGDGQLAAMLQEITGYLLTAETRAEKAFLFHGNGSNGKSVLGKVIRELVGEANVSSVSLSSFSQQFGMEPLIGKTVNLASENEISTRVNTENLKSVVSGDKISISIKYKNAVGYTPICKLVFLVNSLPETSDATYGFYRKLLIVPFNHKFTDEDKDVNLFEKLKAEMPGVFNWAIEGLRRLKENQFRFSQCDAAEHALQAYQEEQNAVPRFVADCVRRENGVCVAKSALLSAYRGWLERNGLDDPCRGNCQRFWREYKLAAELNGVPYAEKKIRGDRYIDDTRLEEVVAAEDGGIDFAE